MATKSIDINQVEVSDSALKHFKINNGNESLRKERLELATDILNNRQGEIFPIDNSFSNDGAIHLIILSTTAYGFREQGIVLSGTTATLNHYLEHKDIKRMQKKQMTLNQANENITFKLVSL